MYFDSDLLPSFYPLNLSDPTTEFIRSDNTISIVKAKSYTDSQIKSPSKLIIDMQKLITHTVAPCPQNQQDFILHFVPEKQNADNDCIKIDSSEAQTNHSSSRSEISLFSLFITISTLIIIDITALLKIKPPSDVLSCQTKFKRQITHLKYRLIFAVFGYL